MPYYARGEHTHVQHNRPGCYGGWAGLGLAGFRRACVRACLRACVLACVLLACLLACCDVADPTITVGKCNGGAPGSWLARYLGLGWILGGWVPAAHCRNATFFSPREFGGGGVLAAAVIGIKKKGGAPACCDMTRG